jgi:PAS domain S-box-containing protein
MKDTTLINFEPSAAGTSRPDCERLSWLLPIHLLVFARRHRDPNHPIPRKRSVFVQHWFQSLMSLSVSCSLLLEPLARDLPGQHVGIPKTGASFQIATPPPPIHDNFFGLVTGTLKVQSPNVTTATASISGRLGFSLQTPDVTARSTPSALKLATVQILGGPIQLTGLSTGKVSVSLKGRPIGQSTPVPSTTAGRALALVVDFTAILRRHIALIAIERQRSHLALEEALVEIKTSENKLRTIIDTIPALPWSARPDGSAEFFNRRWLDYAGLSAEEAADWGWTVALHPEDRARLMDYWRYVLASGETGEIEACLRRFDGEFRWFLFRASPLRNDSGKVVKWYGTNTDLEDRKRAEDALRSNEQSLRLIVDSIPGFVSTFNAAGKVELHNRQVLEYTGKTAEEMKNWATSEIVHPDECLNYVGTEGMLEVNRFLEEELKLEPILTSAAADVFRRSNQLGMPAAFEHEPARFTNVIDYLDRSSSDKG